MKKFTSLLLCVAMVFCFVFSCSAYAEESKTSNEPACTLSGGGYVVEILRAEKAKDGLGNDCITVRFRFTNNNPEPIAFAFIEIDTVKQDGKTLSCDGMVIDPSVDPDVMGLCQQVSNGQSVNIALVYPYTSDKPLDYSLTIVKDLNSIVPLASGSCTLELQ